MDSIDNKDSFFGIIAGNCKSKNIPYEIRVSKIFQACFLRSKIFRESVMELICSAFANNLNIPKSTFERWNCNSVVNTPEDRNLHPDLELYYSRTNKRDKVKFPKIYIECKVGAPLSFKQLSAYKNIGRIANLISITKNIPELRKNKLTKLEIPSIRWQDIHYRLKQCNPKELDDRFVVHEFIRFLEISNMAYELPTEDDLNHIHRFLISNKPDKNHFSVADINVDSKIVCNNFIKDLSETYVWHYPLRKPTSVKKWGPKFYSILPYGYGLCYSWFEKDKPDKHEFCWGFFFPLSKEDNKVYCFADYVNDHKSFPPLITYSKSPYIEYCREDTMHGIKSAGFNISLPEISNDEGEIIREYLIKCINKCIRLLDVEFWH